MHRKIFFVCMNTNVHKIWDVFWANQSSEKNDYSACIFLTFPLIILYFLCEHIFGMNVRVNFLKFLLYLLFIFFYHVLFCFLSTENIVWCSIINIMNLPNNFHDIYYMFSSFFRLLFNIFIFFNGRIYDHWNCLFFCFDNLKKLYSISAIFCAYLFFWDIL